MCRQKIEGADSPRPYDLSSVESDEAESNLRIFECQSPASYTLYDDATLSDFIGENSPRVDLVVEENLHAAPDKFLLDGQDQHREAMENGQFGATCLAESMDSFSTMGYCTHRFTSSSLITPSPLCLDCRVDLNSRTYCTHWREVKRPIRTAEDCGNSCDMDHDYLGTVSSNKSNGMPINDSKETITCEICNNPVLYDESVRNSLPILTPSDSCESFDKMQDEVTISFVVPSGSALVGSSATKGTYCDRTGSTFLLEETLNSSCTCMPDRDNGKPKCNEFMNLSHKACKNAALLACTDSTECMEGTKGCINSNASSIEADNPMICNTLSGSYNDFQSGTSESTPHRVGTGIPVISDAAVVDGVLVVQAETDFSGLNLYYGTSEYKHAGMFSDEVGSAIVYSTASPNSTSGTGAALNCQDQFDVNDDFSDVKNEDIESTRFLSTTNWEPNSVEIQNNVLLEGHCIHPSRADSASVKFDFDNSISACRDLKCEDIFGNINGNQLDGDLVGWSELSCNFSTQHNEKTNNGSAATVSNQNDEDGSSTKCVLLDETYRTHVCNQLSKLSKDAGELKDFNPTIKDNMDVSTTIDEPNMCMKEDLNDSSVSTACLQDIEITHEDENLVPENSAVNTDKKCSSSTIEDLWEDNMNNGVKPLLWAGNSEYIIEREVQELFVTAKKSSHTFGLCQDMEGTVKQLFTEEMSAENGFSYSLKNSLIDSIDCKSASEPKIDKECCKDNGRMKYHTYLDVSDQDQTHQSDLSKSDYKLMPLLDGNDEISESGRDSKDENHMLEIGGLEFSSDSREVCLDIPATSNRDPEAPNKVNAHDGFAPELGSFSNLAHNNVCSTSIKSECLSSLTVGNRPCSTHAFLENSSSANQCSCRIEKNNRHIVDEIDYQVHGVSTSHEDVDSTANMAKDREKHVLDQGAALTSKQRDTETIAGSDRKPNKKILLKSVAGGVTLFGGLFLLLHLSRKGGEKEKYGKKPVEKYGKIPVSSQIRKPSQERQPKVKVNIYPGERLNLKD
ncbi:uncharacterized protein LOC143848480 isoform X2 [Tasmannia lanceolata]